MIFIDMLEGTLDMVCNWVVWTANFIVYMIILYIIIYTIITLYKGVGVFFRAIEWILTIGREKEIDIEEIPIVKKHKKDKKRI